MTARCDSKIFIIVLTLLFSGFVLSKIKKFYYNDEKNKTNKNISNIQKLIYIVTIVLTVIGTLIYLGRKKLEYKEQFNYYNFIIGNPNCKFKTIKDTHSYIKLFKHAFQ